jgi:hypothetical protein
LREDDLGDAVEHGGFVGDVAVEHHRVSAHCVAEAAHGQSVRTVAVDDRQRGLQDHRPAELIAVLARAATGGSPSSAPAPGPVGCLVMAAVVDAAPSDRRSTW